MMCNATYVHGVTNCPGGIHKRDQAQAEPKISSSLV